MPPNDKYRIGIVMRSTNLLMGAHKCFAHADHAPCHFLCLIACCVRFEQVTAANISLCLLSHCVLSELGYRCCWRWIE